MIEDLGKKVRIGGQDFVIVEESKLPRLDNGKAPDPNRKVLLACHPPDDKREFPGDAPLEDGVFFLGAGVATHKVAWWDDETLDGERLETAVKDPVRLSEFKREGLQARQLEVFSEFDWYGECHQVLDVHGWLDRRGGLAQHIIEHVVEHFGQEEIDKAKEQYGDEWSTYVGELAAVRLAPPLSRLWYAVNMMSLYYIHYDDLRLGYLWAEYRMRVRHEQDSFRGKKSVSSARDGGELRAKRFEARSREIITRMEAHVENGMSVSNAAKLIARAGVGTSAEANRKLWNRRRSK